MPALEVAAVPLLALLLGGQRRTAAVAEGSTLIPPLGRALEAHRGAAVAVAVMAAWFRRLLALAEPEASVEPTRFLPPEEAEQEEPRAVVTARTVPTETPSTKVGLAAAAAEGTSLHLVSREGPVAMVASLVAVVAGLEQRASRQEPERKRFKTADAVAMG